MKQISYPNLEGTIRVIDWEIKSRLIIVNINAFVFNRSPLQNEHNISLRVATPNGRISGNLTNEFTKPHEYYNQNLRETLHYGFPASVQLQISYANTGDLPGYKSEVFFFFGGKLSPMKFCKYTFDFHHGRSSDVSKFFMVNYENENPDQYEDGLYNAITIGN